MPESRLTVERRAILGRRVGQLRRRGLLPAVIYGHGDSIPVQVALRAFELGYRNWGRTTLITLQGIDGDIPALIRDVSRDPRTGKLLHADFFRVSLTEKVRAEVPVHFIGESPAVRNLSAVLLHAMDHLRVEALPQDIPHRFDVDLAALETMEDSIHVRDVRVATALVTLLDDPDELVVKVVPQRVEEVAPAAPAVEAEVPAEGEAAEAPTAEGGAPAAPQAAPTKGAAQPQPPQPQPQQKK